MSNSTEQSERNIAAVNVELPTIEVNTKFLHIMSRKVAKELGMKWHFTGLPCIRGHVVERYTSNGSCSSCRELHHLENKEERNAYTRSYRLNNIDAVRAGEKNYYRMNIPSRQKYRSVNRDRDNKARNSRRAANPSRYREKAKERRIKNPSNYIARHLLCRVVLNWKGGRAKSEMALGYTYQDLKQHMESQFIDGMCWERRSEWHIDHIKPISVFLKEGVTNPKIINALSNLQPLWAFDNLSKGSK